MGNIFAQKDLKEVIRENQVRNIMQQQISVI
jgi:hypothetical protein